MTTARQDWWLGKIVPGVVSGVVTGVILYYALPPAVAAWLRSAGTPVASAIQPMINEDTQTYYPCVSCERNVENIGKVTPIW